MSRRPKPIRLLVAVCLVTTGCGSTSAEGETPTRTVEVTESSFECILDGEKVRSFYVGNLLGDLDASLAVAEGDAPLPYPPGTLLQLVPQEAMVKREPGFSPETNDWEFFFLGVTPDGTTIEARGREEASNAFGLNCFDCHVLAEDNDFVCETGNGCDPLPLTTEAILSIQQTDPRCD